MAEPTKIPDRSASARTRVEPGVVIADKFRVDEVLTAGGMGYLVAATHLDLQERVVLKLMLPGGAARGELRERFLREARASARLRGEHVVKVKDIGTLADGAPYMVMEYLDGSDLAALLAARGSLPVAEAVDLLLPVCEALAEAHARGIVHRDLKPGNVFISRRPDGSRLVKLVDFGIAKVTGDAELTGSLTAMGTPAYMAPEQMQSARDTDARADIWSFGVVLHECLLGRRPFEAASFPGLCLAVTMAPLPPLPGWLPPLAAEVLRRCLDKHPARRYPSTGDLAAALAPLAGDAAAASSVVTRARALGRGVVTLEPGRAPRPSAPPTTLGGSTAAVSGRGPASLRAVAAIATAALASGALVATALLVANGRSPTRGAVEPVADRVSEGAAAGTGRDIPSPAAPGPAGSAAMAPPTSSTTSTTPPPASSSTTPPVIAPVQPATGATTPPASTPEPPASSHRSSPPRRHAVPPERGTSRSTMTVPPAPPSPPPAASSLPRTSASTSILIRLYSMPSGATVTRQDGTRLGYTPLQLTAAPGDGPLHYRLSLPGHAATTITIDPATAPAIVERSVVLEALASSPMDSSGRRDEAVQR